MRAGMSKPRTILVLGGARSGKSRHAQSLAEAMTPQGCFIATAQAWDDEMRERIARHVADRDARWTTVDARRWPCPRRLPNIAAPTGWCWSTA